MDPAQSSGHDTAPSGARSIPIFCFVFVALLTAFPEIAPAVVSRPGLVWTPLNSSRLHIGDSSCYAAFTAEVFQGRIPPNSPAAHDKHDKVWIELFKTVPHVIAAFPGLVFSDFRVVYVISLCSGPALLFIFCYLGARRLSVSPLGSGCIGLVVVYYLSAVAPLLSEPKLIDGLAAAFLDYRRILDVGSRDYDLLNDNFRYLITSISSGLGMLFLVLLMRAVESGGTARILLAAASGFLLAFSYLPATAVFYSILLALFLVLCIEGNRVGGQRAFLIGGAIITGLMLSRYPSLMSEAQENTAMWKLYFAKTAEYSQANYIYLSRTLWRWAGISIVCLTAGWRHTELRRWLLATTIVGLGICVWTLRASSIELFGRFFSRAFIHPWMFLSLVAMSLPANRLMHALDCSGRLLRRASRCAAYVLIVAFLVAVPLYGFLRFGWVNALGTSRFVPEEQWKAYQWLRQHTAPDDVVLAMDWDDVYLLPIYTRNDLLHGHMEMQNLTPRQAVERYIASWRLLGFSRAEFAALVADSLRRAREKWTLPVAREDAECAALVLDLVFWPYVSRIDDVPVLEPGTDKVNPAFVGHVLRIFDELDWKTQVQRSECRWVLISDLHFGRTRRLDATTGFLLRHSSAARRIYQIDLQRALATAESR